MGDPVQFGGVNLNHALGQAMGDALARGILLVGVGRRGDGALDQVHRRILQDSGRVAILVAHDHAAGHVGRVAVDPGQFQRQRIERQHVQVQPLHRDRGIGRHRVHPAAIGQFAAPQFSVPTAALQPLAGFQRLGRLADDAGKFLRALRLAQIGLAQQIGAGEEMGVGVGEAGHDEGAAQIDDPRALARLRLDRRRADRGDASAGDADRRSHHRHAFAGPDRRVDIGGVEHLSLRPQAAAQCQSGQAGCAPGQHFASAEHHCSAPSRLVSSSRSSL